jgi:hypothetical protein
VKAAIPPVELSENAALPPLLMLDVEGRGLGIGGVSESRGAAVGDVESGRTGAGGPKKLHGVAATLGTADVDGWRWRGSDDASAEDH